MTRFKLGELVGPLVIGPNVGTPLGRGVIGGRVKESDLLVGVSDGQTLTLGESVGQFVMLGEAIHSWKI